MFRVRLASSPTRATAKLVGKHALILSEDLTIDNMTASANGTAEKPGKNIKQKAGLNRAILDTAPGSSVNVLCTKAQEAECQVILLDPRRHRSSQACPSCGSIRKRSLAGAQNESAVRIDVAGGRTADRASSVRLNTLLEEGLRGSPRSRGVSTILLSKGEITPLRGSPRGWKLLALLVVTRREDLLDEAQHSAISDLFFLRVGPAAYDHCDESTSTFQRGAGILSDGTTYNAGSATLGINPNNKTLVLSGAESDRPFRPADRPGKYDTNRCVGCTSFASASMH